MRIKVRNNSFVPHLGNEGRFICPMPTPKNGDTDARINKLKPFERLFYHQTLSSVRQCKRFVPSPQIPRDSLDFQLQSRYVHSREIFPEKVDTVLQKETCTTDPSVTTFRQLRNTRTYETIEPPVLGHPLVIGGVKEKISPHSVKLINSGPHSQLTNNGYSRQPADGNFFRY